MQVILVIFILIAIPAYAQTNSQRHLPSNEGVTHVSHYAKGFSPLFRIYLSEILKTALDKSTEEYGPYRLDFYSKRLSTNRSKLEAERGILIDLLFATDWNGYYTNTKNMIPLHLPVLDGLLGLRSLVVTKEMNEVFNDIQTKQEFTQYIAGQGTNWEDIALLKANQIRVTEAQHFDALFPMLAKKRFDYISLSSLEVRTALRTKGVTFTNLMANNSLSIYYPLPFYLFVNGKRPELAERLKRGFDIAMMDGTIDRIFDRHFGFIKKELEKNVKNLVLLKNPVLGSEQNEIFTDRFLSKYQSYFNMID